MSNVRTVKSKMDLLSSTIQSTTNSINNVLSTVDSSDDSTANRIIPPCENLLNDLGKLQIDLTGVFTLTSVELHLFFKDYNNELSQVIGSIGQVMADTVELMTIALVLHGLYLMSMAMEGFLQYDLSMSDVTVYTVSIRELQGKLELLKQDTILNNSKLIIRDNRG